MADNFIDFNNKSLRNIGNANSVNGPAVLDNDGKLVASTMPSSFQILFRRGTIAEVAATTLASGEPGWSTDTLQLVVGDAGTAGGNAVLMLAELPSENSTLKIRQNGTGGIQFGTGGDARGSSSADFQTFRSCATMVASGDRSFIAGGADNTASGESSHAEGQSTLASNFTSHAEGYCTTSSSYGSHSEGQSTTASSPSTHAEGFCSTASCDHSHAEGAYTTASGLASHAEGNCNTASGCYAHAEGANSYATNIASHVEGYQSCSSGVASHAEGSSGFATGNYSHAEGYCTNACATASHAEGQNTTASGYYSHAEGFSTTASNYTAHAEGHSTCSDGYASHSEGLYSKARLTGQHAAASGQITAVGDMQYSRYYVYDTTTNNTPANIGLGGSSSDRVIIPAESSWAFTVLISAYNVTDNTAASYVIRGGIRRNNSNSTVIVGTIAKDTFEEAGMSSCDATVIADDTNEALIVQVTGLTSKTIKWHAVIQTSEVCDTAP